MLKTTTLKAILLILISAVISIISWSIIRKTSTYAFDEGCSKVEIIYARGSGKGNPEDDTGRIYLREIETRIQKRGISVSHYLVGTESQGGYKYPHIDVMSDLKILYDAITSAGRGGEYGESVFQGTLELFKYIHERYNRCKESGTYFILGGYSQGAHVVGDALEILKKEIRDRIVFVGLFGDPKLYYPEGKGDNPPACRGKSMSPYRRVVLLDKCKHWQGTLKAREPYMHNDMMEKVGLWCYDRDLICGTSNVISVNDGHGKYANENRAAGQAAREAAARLQHAIENEPKPSPKPTPKPKPKPELPVTYSKIDTSYKFGMGIVGQDIVYIIDAEGITASSLASFKQSMLRKGPKLLQSNGRFLIVHIGYPVIDDNPPSSYPNIAQNPLSHGQWFIDNIDILDNIRADVPGYPLASMYHALPGLDWRYGAAKSVIFITNKTNYLSPDALGISNEMLAKVALKIDPVNVYPVVPEGAESAYQELANLTSGQVTTYNEDDDLGEAVDVALDKILERPVPFLKLAKYIADPGQEITFDASDSYVVDSTITTYDWDFDGDNIFDATTTTPVIDHTYYEKFDGLMQVRVTAANGLIANMSAVVQVGTYVPPVLPATPQGLKVEVLETNDDDRTVRLSWNPIEDTTTESLALSMNGVILGLLMPDRTSIDITDVSTLIDADFGLNAMNKKGELGAPATVSLDALYPMSAYLSVSQPATQPLGAENITTTTARDTSTSSAADEAVLGARTVELPMSLSQISDTLATTAKPTSSKDGVSSGFDLFWLLTVPAAAGIVLALKRRGVLPIK